MHQIVRGRGVAVVIKGELLPAIALKEKCPGVRSVCHKPDRGVPYPAVGSPAVRRVRRLTAEPGRIAREACLKSPAASIDNGPARHILSALQRFRCAPR